MTQRPLPAPDERSAPYWAAAARRELHLARCSRCHAFSVPPDQMCAQCHSANPEFEFVPVSGRGVVRSWITVRQSFLPGFDEDLPYLLVDVELAEQAELRLIGRLLDGPDAELKLGVPVRVAFEELTEDVRVPAFELEQAL